MIFPIDADDTIAQAWFQAFMGHAPTHAVAPPEYGPFHYRCHTCDVTGHGETCWCCGSGDTLIAGYPTRLTNGADGPRFDEVAA